MRRDGSCTMTQMHFTAIAETLKERRPDRKVSGMSKTLHLLMHERWSEDVRAFADLCQRSYKGGYQFDRDRFLRACGMEE